MKEMGAKTENRYEYRKPQESDDYHLPLPWL